MESIKTIETLVVEDNPADARLITEAFDGFAIENTINVVENGVEALDYLYKRENYKDVETPSLVILDLNLPLKSGREVLKEIKKDDDLKLIPIIVLTTSSSQEDVCESYKYHANAYITKPNDLEEFMDIIRDFERFWFKRATLPVCKHCKKGLN